MGHPLSDDQRRTLTSVLDELIPPSADGRLPGAGALGLADYVEQVVQATPELAGMIAEGLATLDDTARSRAGRAFADLAQPEKVALLHEQPFVFPLMFHVFTGYYKEPRVVAALGLEPRAPHPKGHEMAPVELGLLDTVRRRAPFHRAC